MATTKTSAARSAQRTPAIATGWDRVVRSLHAERRVAPASFVDPTWSSEYVDVRTDRASRSRMSDFGYGADEVGRIGDIADDAAMIGPVKWDARLEHEQDPRQRSPIGDPLTPRIAVATLHDRQQRLDSLPQRIIDKRLGHSCGLRRSFP
jgi:hypothetical protein